jgi:hypothetical protein
MTTYDLTYENGYLLVALSDGPYVPDSGVPRTFGNADTLAIGGETLLQVQEFAGFTASEVSATTGYPVQGLFGTDILNRFDILVDVPRETVTFSSIALTLQGEPIPLEFLVGLATLKARIGGRSHTFLFDTAAPISYWLDEAIARHPAADTFVDHHPVYGPFTTATWRVPMLIEERAFKVRCGQLPEPIAAMVRMAGASGILGNEIMLRSPVSYLPRRSQLLINWS